MDTVLYFIKNFIKFTKIVLTVVVVFSTLMAKYRVKHRKSLEYHPHVNDRAKISNCELKSILENTVNSNRKY